MCFIKKILCCQGKRAGKHLRTLGSFLLCDLSLLESDLYQRGDTEMQWCQTSPPNAEGSLVEKPVKTAECSELLLVLLCL